MIKIMLTLIFSLIPGFSVYAQAQPQPDATATYVQQVMNTFVQKHHIPGAAVELYVNGKLYEQYYGYADQDKQDPVIRKTIFELGSLSKVMTSILLAQEIDWAKMSINDPITKYVKGLSPSFDKIRLQDLATHTAGLPLFPPANITTQEALKEYLSRKKIQPGEQWQYSSIGIGLLGYALESSTESTYQDLYRRHILNPLKMVNGVQVPQPLSKYYAQGYDANGNPVSRMDTGLFPAAGEVKASAADMQRFLSAAIGLPGTPPRVLYPMRLTQSMFVKLDDRYQGLGWKIHEIANRDDIYHLLNVSNDIYLGPMTVQEILPRPFYNGNLLMDKTGNTKGFAAYIAVIPGKKSGIVILVNKNLPNRAIVRTAREILLKTINLT